ncbi:MAG: hypothetical protein ACPIOQ_20570, partial [Promethearchaeia archaeon]
MSGGVGEDMPLLVESDYSDEEEPSCESIELCGTSVRVAGAAFGAKIHQEPEQMVTEALTGAGGEGEEQELDSALDNQARHDGNVDGRQGDATAEIAQDAVAQDAVVPPNAGDETVSDAVQAEEDAGHGEGGPTSQPDAVAGQTVSAVAEGASPSRASDAQDLIEQERTELNTSWSAIEEVVEDLKFSAVKTGLEHGLEQCRSALARGEFEALELLREFDRLINVAMSEVRRLSQREVDVRTRMEGLTPTMTRILDLVARLRSFQRKRMAEGGTDDDVSRRLGEIYGRVADLCFVYTLAVLWRLIANGKFASLIIRLPYTKQEFDNDVKRVAFKRAIAKASGSSADQIELVSISEPEDPEEGSFVVIETKIASDSSSDTAWTSKLGLGEALSTTVNSALDEEGFRVWRGTESVQRHQLDVLRLALENRLKNEKAAFETIVTIKDGKERGDDENSKLGVWQEEATMNGNLSDMWLACHLSLRTSKAFDRIDENKD